ncbi:12567_t:CDS:2, partial [Dentiscutata erythropus]
IQKIYNQWFDKGIKEYTKAGKLKHPSYSLVANWCCGISNAMDRAEDDLIFAFTRINNIMNPGQGGSEMNIKYKLVIAIEME